MHFAIASSVTAACCLATVAATPIELAERQVGTASCIGPIVNFFGWTAESCTNAGSTSQLFNVLKFAPLPQVVDRNYQSDCQRVNTPTDNAKSFAFTSDGFNLRNCALVTYQTPDCSGSSGEYKALTGGFSRCFNETVGSAYVFCKPYSANGNNARAVGLATLDDEDDGDLAGWSLTS